MSNSDEEIDEIIKLIASKNNIAVSKDDPIMVLYTMNDRLIRDSKAAQVVLLEDLKSQMEVIYDKWSTEAKGHSDRILNSSIVSSKEEIAKIMDENSKVIIERWENELNLAFSKFNETIHSSRQSAILNIIASCISFFSALIILYVLINS